MRKRLLFALFLMSSGLTGAWADELSEKQAQELARSFVNSHLGRKGGGSILKSPGQVSELKSLGQVSGLYVFSMSEKGGFVIVSNESRGLTNTDMTSTEATIGWTNVGEATNWNLRSRTTTLSTEDFNGDVTWKVKDNNLDGKTWGIQPTSGINGTPCFASPSYINDTALDPYDWLITPKFTLGGSISFYAWGKDERFMVLYSTDFFNYNPISSLITTTEAAQLYIFDLSNYGNVEGLIAIIHMNSSGHTSESFLYVDDVTFSFPTSEWVKTCNVTNPYRLTGLAQDTSYEVQAQAVIKDGGKWSDTFIFRTPTPLSVESAAGNYWTTDHNGSTGYKTADRWYSLDGRKLSSKPSAKGVYVNNGRKLVIK